MSSNMEQHVHQTFEQLSAKISALEAPITEVKEVQISQDTDIRQINDIITDQQHQIEQYEERSRQCDLIISNLPEADVMID